MGQIRIRGVVRVANAVRRELSRPLSPARKEELQQWVTDSIREVDRILAGHQAQVLALPAPTQRAYRFLATLDFDRPTAPPVDEAPADAGGNVSLVGLKAFWDRILDQLARLLSTAQADQAHESIRKASQNIERYLAAEGLKTQDLTDPSRQARDWLEFFSERKHFDAYLTAVSRAMPALEACLLASGRCAPPVLVQFRPLSGLFRIRGNRNGTQVMLPVPMICFSKELFEALAEAAFNGGSKQAVVEATFSDAYQFLQAELEALSGLEERTQGVHHDLAASFGRVNAQYFDAGLSRPRLAWSKAFTGCKFGHYDPIRDTVVISSSFDRADVPGFVVDFVMYHELLHKKLPADWRNGRQAVHTPEFRREEQRFEQFAAAEAAIRRLARPGC